MSRCVSVTKSASDTVIVAPTTTAASFSVYTKGANPSAKPPSIGTSFTGITVTVRATVALCTSPSLTSNVTVRFDAACVPVGSSELLLNVTARNADSHCCTLCGSDADSVSAPVCAL